MEKWSKMNFKLDEKILSNTLRFSGKTAFLQVTADFVTGAGSEKIIFHLKAFLDEDAKRCKKFFAAQMVYEIYAKNSSLKNS